MKATHIHSAVLIVVQAAVVAVTLTSCVSHSSSSRVLPGAGLGHGAVESAEQHDRAGPIRQTGPALAAHRGSSAVTTGPVP